MSSRALVFSFSLLLLVPIAFAQNSEHAVFGHPAPGHARPPLHILPFTTSGPTGYSPAKVKTAYGFTSISNHGSGQTIAIVDAFDDPTAEKDLGVFSTKFGLPPCTTANGCFKKIYASGTKPATNASWALETALDVEWAHAIAPSARIVLVEASSDLLGPLLHAVDVAVQNNASVVSMSWGGDEFSGETSSDSHFAHNNVAFVAASGDDGHGVEWPSSSHYVVAVGGTTLRLTTSNTWSSETAWSGSGGGLSKYEGEPSYQSGYAIPQANGKRGNPDVAYDANPNTGFPVYDSTPFQGQSGWWQVGGTSAGSPQWAALFAIVNSMRRAAGKGNLPNPASQFLYPVAKAWYGGRFHDITSGTNGTCGYYCNTHSNFDYVTGLGSPKVSNLVNALVAK